MLGKGAGVLLPPTSQLEGVRPSRARYQQPGKSVSAICDVARGMLQHMLSGKWKEDGLLSFLGVTDGTETQ